jgi:hypothetical protein
MTAKFDGPPARYRQRFLECKSWGHTWRHTHDFHLIRNTVGDIIQFTRQLTCSHCQSERHDIYDRRMSLVGRSYHYPDGYQTTGENVVVQQTARQEFMRRLLAKQEDTEWGSAAEVG